MRNLRCARAFTLIEMMVASVIAFVLVAASAQLTAAMARAVKKAEEQGDLGVRAAISHSFLSSLLSPSIYDWNVTHFVVAGVNTAAFGEGACAIGSGMCAATGQIVAPLQICDGATVGQTTCNAPTTTTSDALWAYVLRDDVIEAMSIIDRSGATMNGSCTAANVPLVTTFSVTGANTNIWAVDDIILVSILGHVSIGTVTTALAVNTDPAVVRDLSINIGGGTNLDNDDGASTVACSATASLKGAKVLRIRHVIVKQDPATRQLLFGHRDSGAEPMVFDTIVSEVDDLGLQLDIVRIPDPGVPGLCVSNKTDVFAGALIGAGLCNGERLNGEVANGTVNRVIGLRIALLLRTGVETETVTTSTPGLFDRTGTTFSDKRVRRTSLIYVGLPNAANL